jgi:hypothetical protein
MFEKFQILKHFIFGKNFPSVSPPKQKIFPKMSQFAEDTSASYLKQAKSHGFSFYAKMDQRKAGATEMANLRKTLGAFYNYSPPSLPRNYLPPQELSEKISQQFDSLRNRVLETRSYLLKFQQEEQDNNNTLSGKRRNRNDDGDQDQKNKKQKKMSFIESSARNFFSQKTSLDLLTQHDLIPSNGKGDFNQSKWIAFLYGENVAERIGFSQISSVFTEDISITSTKKYSENEFLLRPKAMVSLLSRMTPGMSNILVETICGQFSKIANSKEETIRVSLSAGTQINICVEAKNLPTTETPNLSSSPSPSLMGRRSHSGTVGGTNSQLVEGLIRFVALLRHSGLGCWMFASLSTLELPLSVGVTSSLQQTLRICCQSLKTLFDLRPDLLNLIVDGKEEGETVVESTFSISKLPPPISINESEENNNKNNTNLIEVKILADGINFLTVQDARALISLIVVIGKNFKQANSALLPL